MPAITTVTVDGQRLHGPELPLLDEDEPDDELPELDDDEACDELDELLWDDELDDVEEDDDPADDPDDVELVDDALDDDELPGRAPPQQCANSQSRPRISVPVP